MERFPFPLGPGYEFCPTDQQLVIHYLKKKILNQQLPADMIPTVNLRTYVHPVQLPLSEFFHATEKEWYFFTTKPEHMNDCWKKTSRFDISEGNEVVGFTNILALSNSEQPLPFPEPEEKKKNKKRKKINKWYIQEYAINPLTIPHAQLEDQTIKNKILNTIVCKVYSEEETT